MKCTTLLEMQHKNLHQLCEQVERGSPSMRESLLPQLANDLTAHLRIEEQIFYPEARRLTGRPRRDLRERLRSAQAKIARLLRIPPTDEEFGRRAAELRVVLEEHIREEEGGLFPVIEETLPAAENRALAVRMMHLHGESVEAGYERTSLILAEERRSTNPHARA
jgi:iron-sulfur cluster repair protein YtfE (RIC family)